MHQAQALLIPKGPCWRWRLRPREVLCGYTCPLWAFAHPHLQVYSWLPARQQAVDSSRFWLWLHRRPARWGGGPHLPFSFCAVMASLLATATGCPAAHGPAIPGPQGLGTRDWPTLLTGPETAGQLGWGSQPFTWVTARKWGEQGRVAHRWSVTGRRVSCVHPHWLCGATCAPGTAERPFPPVPGQPLSSGHQAQCLNGRRGTVTISAWPQAQRAPQEGTWTLALAG